MTQRGKILFGYIGMLPLAMSLPPELATQAAFFARLHKVTSVEEWLRGIIEERIDFEEAAFARLKQALAAKGSS